MNRTIDLMNIAIVLLNISVGLGQDNERFGENDCVVVNQRCFAF